MTLENQLLTIINNEPEDILQDKDALYKKNKDLVMDLIKVSDELLEFYGDHEIINDCIFNSQICKLCGDYYSIKNQDTQHKNIKVPFSKKILCCCYNDYLDKEISEGHCYIDEDEERKKMTEGFRNEYWDDDYSDDDDGDFDDIGLFNSYRQR
jgi:hypothetical protein